MKNTINLDGIRTRLISNTAKHFIFGAIFGIAVTLFVDYVAFKDQKISINFHSEQNRIKTWNENTKNKKEEIVVSVLAYFPFYVEQIKEDPKIWATINSFVIDKFSVRLPIPAYMPFIYDRKKQTYSATAQFLISKKNEVHKYLQSVDIKSLKDYWPANMITDNRQTLTNNWDKMVLESANKRFDNQSYQLFKKNFLGNNN